VVRESQDHVAVRWKAIRCTLCIALPLMGTEARSEAGRVLA
jgi:hypothetical protein